MAITNNKQHRARILLESCARKLLDDRGLKVHGVSGSEWRFRVELGDTVEQNRLGGPERGGIDPIGDGVRRGRLGGVLPGAVEQALANRASDCGDGAEIR